MRAAMKHVDAKASRYFSVYLDSAKMNACGFQSFLIKTKSIPQAQLTVESLEREMSKFTECLPEIVRKFVKRKWNWRERHLRFSFDNSIT